MSHALQPMSRTQQPNSIINPRLHDTTCCQTGCTTRFDNRLNEQLFVQHGCQTGCQTRLTLSNPFDNRLYRVNGV